ncbi:serine/threonine-protein kinase [Streptomyces sp. NPDC088124]|uniref:serine/threonine-protein kinase n=1 Tax=Streptomyces sp. NPDC088124 TaxID=3154654 RepID=UPI00341B1A58
MGADTGTGAATGTDTARAGVENGPVLAGRYRLGEAIGSGGMGKVWRAHDEVLHRTVAIKELTAGLYASEADRAVLHRRTQKEARAAARITHPAVVTVHDVLHHDDRPWIVMEYVDGPSLADAAKESGPFDPREAARIGLAVLGGLRAAHSAGVLHRDVKPGNVLLARDGRVLLTDFGIAAIEGDATITRTGEVVGSIDYLAPERVRGKDPGPASDLWSLGVTLYTAVQGISPFRRSSPLTTMQAVVSDEPAHPDRAGALAPVIVALLRKDPVGRPDTAECERMLREVAAGRSPDGTGAPGAPDARGEAPTYTATRVVPTGNAESVEPAGPAESAAYPESPGRPVDSVRAHGSSATAHVPRAEPMPAAAPPPVPAPAMALAAVAPAPGRQGRGRRWRTVAVAVVAAAVLGGGAGFVALKLSDGGSGTADDATGPNVSAGQSDGGGGGDDADDADDSSTGGSVAKGWKRVTAPEGFSINLPKGWTRLTDSTQIDYSPDGGVTLLRISIGAPDFETPMLHAQSMEQSLRERLEYTLIELQPNRYRDQAQAALWEFTWMEKGDRAGKWHAIDQIYYSDDSSTEYAIYMSGPEKGWAKTRKQFDAILRSWTEPPGGSGDSSAAGDSSATGGTGASGASAG